jgi:hypothetical protein
MTISVMLLVCPQHAIRPYCRAVLYPFSISLIKTLQAIAITLSCIGDDNALLVTMLSVSIAFSLCEGLLATTILARASYCIKPLDRRLSIVRTTGVTVDDEPDVDESTPLLVKNKSTTETTSITQMRGLTGVTEVRLALLQMIVDSTIRIS